MIPVAVAFACVVLAGSVIASIVAIRGLRVDELDAGPWAYADTCASRVVTADLNSMILRLERARHDTIAWENVLRRLDALHVQLSPFGQNARRPPFVRKRWWGTTTVEPEAPAQYDRGYLDTYIATLERLAGGAASTAPQAPAPDQPTNPIAAIQQAIRNGVTR